MDSIYMTYGDTVWLVVFMLILSNVLQWLSCKVFEWWNKRGRSDG